jgi:GntR family transcriptional regulator
VQIQIVPNSSIPIFRQIADQVRRLVATGKLQKGDPVPSVRQLAKDLVINPNTVAKAYAELTRDGVLEGQQGRGLFVANRKSVYTKAERLRRLDEAIQRLIGEGLTLDFAAEDIIERVTSHLGKLTHETR